MKVVLLSNFLNPHTVNLCLECLLHKKVKEFYFIATVQQSKERELLGFKELNHQYDFVLRMYNENEKKNCNRIDKKCRCGYIRRSWK